MTEPINTTFPEASSKGFSGSTLKIIAILSMLIDHIAAIILTDNILQKLALNHNDYTVVAQDPVYVIMIIMRCIGRLAFPMFCFLLIEGFLHTHNKMKYAARLLLFAFLSEIPFDYAVNHTLLEFGYQNVFFTLFLGLMTMILYDMVAVKYKDKPGLFSFFQTLIFIGAILVSLGLRADYGMIGIVTIYLMYCFRNHRKKQILIGCFALTFETASEIFTFAVYPLLKRYNGERGMFKLKYFFYLFYPAHILILALISQLLGYR